jgi:hypothetical protein
VKAQENVEVRGDDSHLDYPGTLLSRNDRQMLCEVFGGLQAERGLTMPSRPDDVDKQAMPHGPDSVGMRLRSVSRERKAGLMSPWLKPRLG